MKAKILTLLFCVITLMAMGQGEKYTITGHISSIEHAQKVMVTKLSYLDGEIRTLQTIDSAIITNGTFSLSGYIDRPTYVVLNLIIKDASYTPNNFLRLFLTGGDMTISTDSIFSQSQIKGSVINEAYRQLMALSLQFSYQLRPLNEHYYRALKQADLATMRLYTDSLKMVQSQREQAFIEFIQAHNNSPVALFAASLLPDQHKADSLFSSALAASVNGQEYFAAQKTRGPKVRPGEKAPDFTLTDVKGKSISLSDFKGKYVLVDIWASWCSPCRMEIPFMKKLYAAVNGPSFQLLYVSIDSDREKWLAAIEEEQVSTWTNITDLKAGKGVVSVNYGIKSIPHNLLVGPDGILLAENVHGTELLDLLTKYLSVK